MNLTNLSVVLVTIGLSATACGPIKDMKQMKNTTDKMNDNTNQLLQTSKSMQKTTEELLVATKEMQAITQQMLGVTKTMAQGTHTDMEQMGTVMKSMGAAMDKMLTSMSGMSGKMDKMDHLSKAMDAMTDYIKAMSGSMTQMLGSLGGMTDKMGTLSANMVTMTEYIKSMSASMGQMLESMKSLPAMQGQMGQMVAGMKTLENLTRDMKRTTASLERGQRTITTRDRRLNEFVNLTSNGLRLENRIVSAGTYVRAFEFQGWKGYGVDTLDQRQRLFAEAAQEFLTDFRGLHAGKYPAPDPTSQDTRMQSMLAISYVVDLVDQVQYEASKSASTSFKTATILSLIETGLLSKKTYETNPRHELPAYVREVLFNEADARYLLNLRIHMISGALLDFLLNFSADSELKQFLGRIVSRVGATKRVMGSAIDIKADRLTNSAVLEKLTVMAQQARSARAVLAQSGRAPALDPGLEYILTHLTVPTKLTAHWEPTRVTAFQRFWKELEAWRCDIATGDNRTGICQGQSQPARVPSLIIQPDIEPLKPFSR